MILGKSWVLTQSPQEVCLNGSCFCSPLTPAGHTPRILRCQAPAETDFISLLTDSHPPSLHLRSGQARFSDRAADIGLIAVALGSVDVSVPSLKIIYIGGGRSIRTALLSRLKIAGW